VERVAAAFVDDLPAPDPSAAIARRLPEGWAWKRCEAGWQEFGNAGMKYLRRADRLPAAGGFRGT